MAAKTRRAVSAGPEVDDAIVPAFGDSSLQSFADEELMSFCR